jgi:hypothetical protein
MTTDTAAATLARFDQAFASLEQTVRSVSPRELTEIRDPAGWSAKDHVLHVALWEQALLASVDGRPRHQALGLDPSTEGSEDWDGMNAMIFANTRQQSLDDALHALRATHATTRVRVVAAVSGVAGGAGDKLLADLPGYIDHYDQHRGWIEELVRRPA